MIAIDENHRAESPITVGGRRRHFGSERPQSTSRPQRDSSGYTIFSAGEIGAAHVRAHARLDAGELESGRVELGTWLAGRTGTGSDWVHVNFHMALFELGTGDWHSAYRRFMTAILPAASRPGVADTDAPAVLWHLAIASNGPIPLPWDRLQRTAREGLARATDEFVVLHHLLALAGAADVTTLDRWLGVRPRGAATPRHTLLTAIAVALRACAAGGYDEAADRLAEVAPRIALIGGSRAQRDLLGRLERWCAARSTRSATPVALAA